MGWLILLGIVTLLCASPLFAVDSRDGEDWKSRPHPAPPRPGSSCRSSLAGCLRRSRAARKR